MAQMMFFSGVIKQENRKYLVNPFEKLVGEPIMLQKDEFVRLTPEAYIKVVDLLDLKHREPICVIYVDSDVDCEKLLDVEDLSVDDAKLEASNEEKLDAFKEKTCRMMNEMISNQLMISNFELFHFFKLNHALAAKGYLITDENREEKYLEVINSGDAETLQVLSEYLDCLDEFNAIDSVYAKFKEYKEKVKSATNEKEIEDAFYELSAKLF